MAPSFPIPGTSTWALRSGTSSSQNGASSSQPQYQLYSSAGSYNKTEVRQILIGVACTYEQVQGTGLQRGLAWTASEGVSPSHLLRRDTCHPSTPSSNILHRCGWHVAPSVFGPGGLRWWPSCIQSRSSGQWTGRCSGPVSTGRCCNLAR